MIRKTLAALAAAGLALSGCGAAPPACPPTLTKYVQLQPTPIPPSILNACPVPPAPPPDGSMQSAGDDWVAKVIIDYSSCREGYKEIAAFQASLAAASPAPVTAVQPPPLGPAPAKPAAP